MTSNIHSTQSKTYTIAIIGGGFSGIMVAIHLLQNANTPLCINLIERQIEVGTGVAYSTSIYDHLLNVPAGKMSAFPDQPDHFLTWLKQQENRYPTLGHVTATAFVHRAIYGDYLQAILSDVVTNLSSPARLERITAEANAIEPTDTLSEGGAWVQLSTGESLYANQVVLALGNFPANLPAPLKGLSDRHVKEAWVWDATDKLDPDDAVLLVGTGLTMVDLVMTLRQQGHRGKIYASSRHGLLPQRHQLGTAYPLFLEVEQAPKTTRELLQRVRQAIAHVALQGQDWRAVIDSLRPITQALWQRLPVKEQQRFLRHVKSYWEVCRHRIAPRAADGLEELLQLGQLTYYAGRIQTCQTSDHGVEVAICQRGTKDYVDLQVQRIINCTGSNGDYSVLRHPLVVSLQEQRLIRPHVLTGIDTVANGEIVDADGNISNWLYTLGTARKGNLWETTAVPELRVQAQALALTLLRSPSVNTISTHATAAKGDRGKTFSRSLKSSLIFRQLFDPMSCTYTYLIGDADSRQAILVDPVWEQVERDLRVLRELDLTLHFCLETHVHADHITGASELRSRTGCQIFVPQQANVTEADRWIADNEILQLGCVIIRSINTPGHTDSHMVYLVNDTHLLSGDTLFIRGCGRTDFQGGNAGALYDVVTQELFKLPDDTLVYPGHDYQGQTVSTIGEEKLWNPRFVERDRAQFIDLMANLKLPYPKKMREAISANQRCGETAEESNLDEESTERSGVLIADDSSIFLGMYI
jgi:uncharacterized NAD(P)/FAD-binding protein YdhS/glyoxylase-like metal-dependent hydrolase (beta-lactamase superfamily II)